MNLLGEKHNILIILLSFLSTYSLQFMLKSDSFTYLISNSVFSLVTFGAIFILMRNAFQKLNMRLLIVSIILGFFFSMFMICGVTTYFYKSTFLNSGRTILRIIFGIPLWTSLVINIFWFLDYLNNNVKKRLEEYICLNFREKKFLLIHWWLIFLAWLPVLLAAFPGIYANDCVFQLNYYLTDKISLHHPLIHTYFLGVCVKTLGDFLGSYENGLLIYSLVQMLLLSFFVSLIPVYMKLRKIDGRIYFIVLVFIIISPYNSIMSITATKDVLFSGFFSAFIFFLLFGLHTKKLNDIRIILCLIINAFMMIIFRNQGIYVFVLGMFTSIMLLKDYRKHMMIIFLIVMSMYGMYTGPLSKALNGIKPQSVKEYMSVPCVQLSRSMSDYQSKLTNEEKTLINKYVPEWHFYHKNQEGISDLMKRSFNSDAFKKNPMEFIKLWYSVGIKTPISYIDAFARITIGLWYPDMNYRDKLAYHPYWEYESTKQRKDTNWLIVKRETVKGFNWLDRLLYKISYQNSYQKIPVISMLFSSGFQTWFMFIYIGWCFYKKLYVYLAPVSFIFFYWLTMLLGPVVLFRYVYPMFLVNFLLVATMLAPNEFVEEEKCLK